jgi:hypothetical protein
MVSAMVTGALYGLAFGLVNYLAKGGPEITRRAIPRDRTTVQLSKLIDLRSCCSEERRREPPPFLVYSVVC